MNKKFLSAILFGALAVASTGSFVSCKDYDDDIDNLQTQINGLASAKDLSDKVSALQSAISSAQTAAEAKAAAAQAVADAAKAAAEKAGADAKAANDAAAAAAQAAAEALDAAVAVLEKDINDVKGAQAAAEEACKKALDELKASSATKDELKAAVEEASKAAADAIAELAKTKADKTELEAAKDAALAAAKDAKDAAVKAGEDAAAALADAEKKLNEAVAAADAAAKKAQETADKANAAVAELAKTAATKEELAAVAAAAKKAQEAADAAQEDAAAAAAAAKKAQETADDNAAALVAQAKAIAAKADAKTVEGLDTRVKALEDAIEVLTGEDGVAAIAALATTLSEDVEKIQEALGLGSKELKSIVFQPKLYIDGIEATTYTYLKYVALTKDVDLWTPNNVKNDLGNTVALLDTADVKPGYTITQYYHVGNILEDIVEPAGSSYNQNPKNANNHEYIGEPKCVGEVDSIMFAINPANAVVTKEQAKIIAQNKMSATRAEHDTKPFDLNVVDADVKNGILTVYYKVDSIGALISANHDSRNHVHNAIAGTTDCNVNTTMFHAEVMNSDTVINSDWAMLYEKAVQPVALAWKVGADQLSSPDYCDTISYSATLNRELYKNPFEALKAKPSLALGWDDKEGIKLYDLIEIHMNDMFENPYDCEDQPYDYDENPVNDHHKTISLAEAEKKYGLTVKFTPVAYETEEIAGTNASGNKTQPSNYINPALGAKGTVIAGTVSNVNGSFVAKQGVSSVGKQPLVQVLAMKGEDVVLEGYIKLMISRESENKETAVIDLGTQPFDCNGLSFSQQWYQASTDVLEDAMGMSKDEFDKLYKLVVREDCLNDEACAVQYVKIGDKKFKEVEIENQYSIVCELPDPKGTTNTVVAVNLDKFAQQYLIEDKQGNDTIWIKYVPASTDKSGYSSVPGVYIPLTYAVTSSTVELTQSDRIRQYWFNYTFLGASDTIHANPADLNNTPAGLRMNVNQPYYEMDSYKTPAPSFGGNNVEGFVMPIANAYSVYAETDKNDVVLSDEEGVYSVIKSKNAPAPKTMFYFHPVVNNVSFKGDDGLMYKLSVKNNNVVCDKWIKGDGPEFIFLDEDGNPILDADHRSPEAVLNHVIEKIDSLSKIDLYAINQIALSHKINTNSGIFQNNKLFAQKSEDGGKTWSVAEDIAQLNANTGNIWYKHTELAQDVLNAVGHLKAMAQAFVGIYSTDACGYYMPVKNGIFPVYFLRPLDIFNTKAKELLDAEANGSKTSLAEILTFKDWREVTIDQTKNGWMLAYYGVNKISIDLDAMTTDLGKGVLGETLLTSVSKKVKFSLVDAAGAPIDKELAKAGFSVDLSGFNHPVADTNWPTDWSDGKKKTDAHQSEAVFQTLTADLGSLKYDNNNTGLYDFTVRIPVTLSYDWGSYTTFVDVKVVRTQGN